MSNQNENKALLDLARIKAFANDLITPEEFAAVGETPLAKGLYIRLAGLYGDHIINGQTVYNFAKHRWCWHDPSAVIYAEDTSSNAPYSKYHVNTCTQEINEDSAVMYINKIYGFEASRVEIAQRPFYESTDWNFISFAVAGYDYLLHNGELYFTE